jgi:arylsulfatase
MQLIIRLACCLLFQVLTACSADQDSGAETVNEDRPNFLIIMTDDMGYTDLGAFGGIDIATPNLDQLAFDGIRFTNFHGHLSCAPSRATLISGTGNHEAGLGTQTDQPSFRGQRNYERYLTDRVATLPEVLQNGGYRTYLAGKWGLSGPQALDPTERGFEKSFALLPSGGGHYEAIFHDSRYSLNGQVIQETADPTFSTTLFTNNLIAFFEEDRDSSKPFFALFAPTAPHWPLHFPPGMEQTFAGKYDTGYDELRKRRIAGALQSGVLPEHANVLDYESEAAPWDTLSNDDKALQSRIMEIYAAMAAHLDQEIGRLLSHMQAAGALDNTLILVINDNGAQGGPIFGGPRSYANGNTFNNDFDNIGANDSWANMGQGWADAVNAPFRDGKASVYEGGIRVAAFANWSGIRNRSSTYTQYVNNMDVMPTLLELARVSQPGLQFNDRDVLPIRGKSFASVLRGDVSPIHPDDESITLSSAGRHFMQRGQWKILKELNSDWELYDLAADPYERVNLAAAQPEKLQDLLRDFNTHAKINNILDR